MTFADKTVEKLASTVNRGIDVWKESKESGKTRAAVVKARWNTTIRIFLVSRFLLSGFVVWAIVHLALGKVLEPQTVGILLTAVVGSLFIQPKME